MTSPFFIVGSGRCGSTWVYEVLCEHPRLALTNEAHVLDMLVLCSRLASVPRTEVMRLHFRPEVVDVHGIISPRDTELFAPLFNELAVRCCEDYYRRRFPDQDFLYWGDKLPGPDAVQGAFSPWPDTKLLTLVRDPRDVLCSWRAFGQSGGRHAKHAEMTAESLARSWAGSYRELLRLQSGVMHLRYEDLCRDPRDSFGKILAFLGLDWEPAMEEAFRGNNTFASHGTSDSLAASEGRWRQELSAEDIAVIEQHCGEVMAAYGYN